MKVTWLCSRKVEGKISGYYTEKQVEYKKDMVRDELLNSMRMQSGLDAEHLKKGEICLFGTLFYYGAPGRRQDKCIRELYRCGDGEVPFTVPEETIEAKTDHPKSPLLQKTAEILEEYVFKCYKTMYMPVTVTVPDDSAEDDVKKALYEKMSLNYDYRADPYHMGSEMIPPPPGASWNEEMPLTDRIGRGIEDISRLDMYEYEWLKHYKKPISGRYYDDEYEIDWDSMQHIPHNEFEDPEKDKEETDDYWYYRSDSDSDENDEI